ncbi:MAG: hypothetical protein NTY53_07420, partial [Kiritimatiellaeota bacterium]|nr:hypothetical protein [Kiritimatiellota bacterium]
MNMRSTSGLWLAVWLLTVSAGRLAAEETATPAQRELDTLAAHVAAGQYRLAKEDAVRWATMPDADRELLGKGCALLCNKHVFDAALILLRRLDWRIPSDCYWPSEIIVYMQSKGLNTELDQALTSGTALAPKKAPDADEQKGRWGCYQTAIQPQVADQLFNFYQGTNRLDELCRRYERELVKRPQDVGLVTEFAYGLSRFEREHQAVSLIEGLDLKKLDLLTLIGVGHLWYPPHDPTNLVRCTIKPLELALTRKISDDDAQRYTSGWQVMVGTELGKRLIHERLLDALADRYVFTGQLGKAKEKYEAFLALPRREAWGDRTEVQQKYARVLKTLALPDPHRQELETKAQTSGKGADWAAGYFNECMNGFEYQVAWHMIAEGLVMEGLAITRMIHDRYHAARRNPWNE